MLTEADSDVAEIGAERRRNGIFMHSICMKKTGDRGFIRQIYISDVSELYI